MTKGWADDKGTWDDRGRVEIKTKYPYAGSEQDNTLHVDNCKIKTAGASILHEKDDVAERECPNCHSKITGSSEKFARHVEYCLY
jgi:hypothetical protein